MIDNPPLPDFGDEPGLYRLVLWAKARVRASARPPAEWAAILAKIRRFYRAARGGGLRPRCGAFDGAGWHIIAKAGPRYHRIEANGPSGAVLLWACDLPRAGQRRSLTLSALRTHMAA